MRLEYDRPISLVNSLYKIIAKVLARRLKEVLNGVIDHTQSAFIGGRFLLHGVLVVNEVIDEAKKKKKPCLVFKIDYEKVYDFVP